MILYLLRTFHLRLGSFELVVQRGADRVQIGLCKLDGTFVILILAVSVLFMLLPVQTANLQMNLIIMLECIGKFLTQSALTYLSEIDLVMVFVAIEDML